MCESASIADRALRLQMATECARAYPKVLAFWLEVLEGSATYEQDGKKFFRYTTEECFRASENIAAYGFVRRFMHPSRKDIG